MCALFSLLWACTMYFETCETPNTNLRLIWTNVAAIVGCGGVNIAVTK